MPVLVDQGADRGQGDRREMAGTGSAGQERQGRAPDRRGQEAAAKEKILGFNAGTRVPA
jgi:hypothetical protein